MAQGPLAGLRVLELGQLIAGPFAGHMMASFGAEVIKVEAPGMGDPLRRWRKMHGDTSLWWYSLSRGKKSVTCNLREPQGQELVRRLVARGIDILIENFRPGTMERWGLDYETLSAIEPGLIMVRVSGYGQTGPKSKEPGFANIAEAFGGLRYTSGEPGRPPVRTGVSMGDSLAGMHAAYGALAAVHERSNNEEGRGQVVDVALYESVFNMMESLLPEYDLLGHVRQPCGAAVDGIVPSGSYRCSDGEYIAIGANSDRLFRNLMRAMDREDLAEDQALKHNDGRAKHAERIDAAIAAYTSRHSVGQVEAQLRAAEIPCGGILDAAAIANDPHYQARGMLQPMRLPDGIEVKMPGAVPKLSRTPAGSKQVGPRLGEHNDAIYGDWLGLTEAERKSLHQAGVI